MCKVAIGGFIRLAMCFLPWLAGPDARHHGRCEPEGQLRGNAVIDMPVVCNDRCRWVHRAVNCGFSAVAAHQQGRLHPCRGGVADSHGPDCSADHGDSPVDRGQGVDAPVMQVVGGFVQAHVTRHHGSDQKDSYSVTSELGLRHFIDVVMKV